MQRQLKNKVTFSCSAFLPDSKVSKKSEVTGSLRQKKQNKKGSLYFLIVFASLCFYAFPSLGHCLLFIEKRRNKKVNIRDVVVTFPLKEVLQETAFSA